MWQILHDSGFEFHAAHGSKIVMENRFTGLFILATENQIEVVGMEDGIFRLAFGIKGIYKK